MAQELINIGATADDGTGDTIRGAGIKINNNFTELYATSSGSSQISFIQNKISATESNSDISLSGNGTGVVKFTDLTIDKTINISDNDIKVNTSNADLVLTASGTGKIQTSVADVNGGAVDGTVIGGSNPAAGTFASVAYNNTALVIDGVTVNDNTISANASNSNLEFTANGSGYVSVSGIKFPNSGGSAGQVLQTNGSGQLDWFSSPLLFDSTDLTDGTASIVGDSSAQAIDSFDITQFRSANYVMSISENDASRFRTVEANVTHDGTNAYVSVFGNTSNFVDVPESLEYTADINGGNVRLLGTVNNDNTVVVKFVRRIIKV